MKYIKSVLWRVAKRLSCIEYARCLKVNLAADKYTMSPKSVPTFAADIWTGSLDRY